MDRVPFTNDRLEEALDFILSHPAKPEWPEDLTRRFLTQLSSSPECIFDFYNGMQRVGIAVLLDKLKNKGNNAPLEILGVTDMDAYGAAISEAKKILPVSCSGIEVTLHDSFLDAKCFMHANQFAPYYEVFEMVNDSFLSSPYHLRHEIIRADDTGSREIYDVLVESFRDNLDTSISPYDEWASARRKDTESRTWVVRKNEHVVGFLQHHVVAGVAEIRTIGTLPSHRGQGIARDLIRHALQELHKDGVFKCRLSVAVTNEKAASLYRNLGFREIEHYSVFVWKRDLFISGSLGV